jgi:hypothetical protein
MTLLCPVKGCVFEELEGVVGEDSLRLRLMSEVYERSLTVTLD